MPDDEKIPKDGLPRKVPPDTWAEKRQIARGFLEVVRLAERRRRKEAGQPLLQLHDEDQGRAA